MEAEIRSRPSVFRSAAGAPGLFASALQRDVAMKGLCERGAGVFRPFSALMSDVFTFFYQPSAALSDSPDGCDKLHYLVIKYLASQPEYFSLRSRSAGNYHRALAAAEEFGSRLLDHLDKQSGTAAPHASKATEQVEIEEIVLADVAKAGAGAPSSSAVLVLARRVEQAVDAAEVLSDVCHTFGLSPGEMRALPLAQRSELASRMGTSGNLRRFAELVGRWSALAAARKAKRTPGVPEEYSDVTFGDNWHLFVPQELGALLDSTLRYDFYLRLIDRKILQYDPQSIEGQGRGPIIVCVDTSGSMSGDRDVSAKAAALSLYAAARRERRPFAAILFSSPHETLSFLFRDGSVVSQTASGEERRLALVEGMMGFATFFFGGGTDYESPLLEALRLIDNGGIDWREGDIVFITDDYCSVSDQFEARFRHEKERLAFRVFSVIVGARSEDARTLRRFSDRVLSVDDFNEAAAEQVFDAV